MPRRTALFWLDGHQPGCPQIRSLFLSPFLDSVVKDFLASVKRAQILPLLLAVGNLGDINSCCGGFGWKVPCSSVVAAVREAPGESAARFWGKSSHGAAYQPWECQRRHGRDHSQVLQSRVDVSRSLQSFPREGLMVKPSLGPGCACGVQACLSWLETL